MNGLQQSLLALSIAPNSYHLDSILKRANMKSKCHCIVLTTLSIFDIASISITLCGFYQTLIASFYRGIYAHILKYSSACKVRSIKNAHSKETSLVMQSTFIGWEMVCLVPWKRCDNKVFNDALSLETQYTGVFQKVVREMFF